MKLYKKRCLIGLQKGVNKGLKGHLLQVNQASLRSQKSIYQFCCAKIVYSYQSYGNKLFVEYRKTSYLFAFYLVVCLLCKTIYLGQSYYANVSVFILFSIYVLNQNRSLEVKHRFGFNRRTIFFSSYLLHSFNGYVFKFSHKIKEMILITFPFELHFHRHNKVMT